MQPAKGSVFIVQHSYTTEDGCSHSKFIGVYSTHSNASAAVERLRSQPGFNKYPCLVSSASSDADNGFFLSEVSIDEDHWVDGFVQVSDL